MQTILATAIALLAWQTPTPASAPDGWETYSPRAEIAPRFRVEKAAGAPSTYTLGISAEGSSAVDGRWLRKVSVTAGKHYQFTAEFRANRVATPARCVLGRVVWLSAAGQQIGTAEYPVTLRRQTADGWSILADTYPAPKDAAQARLELHLRWTPNGEVVFRNVALKETAPPAPRLVRLATINHRPRGGKAPEENLRQFVAPVAEAARRRADIVCLGEGITVAGLDRKYVDVAEPIPGPSTKFLGELAAKHHLYLVAGLYERDGKVVYNTAVLIGRDGKLIGRYRKVCLPREEIDGGITPGNDYPVFDTDFGRVGLMICWDLQFPEVARELAARGAEVILLPIWGGDATLASARAIENQIFLVASGYDFKTAIYGKKGEVLASATKDPEVLLTEVDLGQKVYWPWLGDLRSRIDREKPAGAAEQTPVR
ncbi:MAG: carbon-nitrogen hydrolase family protein [Pirellulales bacterium]